MQPADPLMSIESIARASTGTGWQKEQDVLLITIDCQRQPLWINAAEIGEKGLEAVAEALVGLQKANLGANVMGQEPTTRKLTSYVAALGGRVKYNTGAGIENSRR